MKINIEDLFDDKIIDIKEIEILAENIMEENITAMRYLQDK
ncbi:hypothetical protein [Fusobacterium mortiferum]|jgi:hypothetical protein|nr:hypothetical protein [Fusobacterium mortiferum]